MKIYDCDMLQAVYSFIAVCYENQIFYSRWPGSVTKNLMIWLAVSQIFKKC